MCVYIHEHVCVPVNVLVCVHARLCVFVCIYIKEREGGREGGRE